jgi:hypothetical protein
MRRTAGLALLALIVAGLATVWFLRLNPGGIAGNTNGKTSETAQNSGKANSSQASEIPADDREPAEAAYRADLKSKVESLIAAASATDAQSVAAEVTGLPSSALPLLMTRINDGSLSPATTRPIADALEQNATRLANALAFQKRMGWYQKNMLDRFDHYAENDPAGRPARIAVHAAVREWARDPRASGDEPMIIWREARAANEIGSGEPLFWFAFLQEVMGLNNPADTNWIYRVAKQELPNIEQSDYPPIVKMAFELQAAKAIADQKPISDQDRQIVDHAIEEAKSRFPAAMADPDLPRQVVLNLFDQIAETSLSVYGDRRTLSAPLFEQLKASKIDPSTALTAQGYFNLDYAWDARGDGWASTITPEGQKLMDQRLAKAAAALEQAWQLDPTNSDAATEMLEVELGQGQGRDRMELWFARAMQADPDNYEACKAKLYYLEPKWYGSGDEMLKFGRECLAGGNWDAGIPYILVKAHLDLAQYGADGWQSKPQRDYFANNPQAWKDIESVYNEHRKHRPMSVMHDLMVARAAEWSGAWDAANQMFDEVGDAYDTSVYSSEEQEAAKQEARSHLTATSQPSGG